MLTVRAFVHYAQLVIEFGPPPVGMHLLAARREMSHYGRRLKSPSNHDAPKGNSKTSNKSSRRSSKYSSKSSKSDDGGSDDGDLPDVPVCPVPDLDMDLSLAVSLDATGDSTIVNEAKARDKSFGSDVILELSPLQCGEMQAMMTFDVSSLASTVEYASILIHVIEGSDLSGATFLHTPQSFNEDSVTWSNAPEYGNVIGSLTTIKNGMVSLRLRFCAVIFCLPSFNRFFFSGMKSR